MHRRIADWSVCSRRNHLQPTQPWCHTRRRAPAPTTKRLPDPSLRGTVVESSTMIAIIQRHLGLYMYVSCLAATLDARAARGEIVTQAGRLGDTAIHAANATARHNAGLHAVYTALSSATATGVSVKLGDKGDGTPASKADAQLRHAHLNSTAQLHSHTGRYPIRRLRRPVRVGEGHGLHRTQRVVSAGPIHPWFIMSDSTLLIGGG